MSTGVFAAPPFVSSSITHTVEHIRLRIEIIIAGLVFFFVFSIVNPSDYFAGITYFGFSGRYLMRSLLPTKRFFGSLPSLASIVSPSRV